MATNQAMARTTCITLAPTDGGGDDRLRRWAEARSWRPVSVAEPLAAMAEAALREREQIARSQWGLPRAESIVLMIAGSWIEESPQQSEQLVVAMERYLPGIELWFHDGETAELIRHSRAAGERDAGEQDDWTDESAGNRTPRDGSYLAAAVTLSREEMTMLLETAPGGDA